MGCFEKGQERKKMVSERLTRHDEMIAKPFEEKLDYAGEMVAEAVREHDEKLALSCSFGKDSTVVLHLALKENPRVPVIFCNTGVEARETIEFKEKLTKDWDLNLFELKPETTFWKIVKEHGYPEIRFKKREPRCCEELKIKPVVKATKEHGFEAIMTGLTAAESYQRKWVYIWFGDKYQMKKRMPWPIWKYHPIMFWTPDEVWRYIRENGLPHNRFYEKAPRVGCIPCTAYIGWKEQMAELFPGLYKKIAVEMGEPPLEAFA